MKMRLFSTLVSALILSTASSHAATSTIGPLYYGQTYLVANQLNHAGGNSLASLFPVGTLPDFTAIEIWNCSAYDTYYSDSGSASGWDDWTQSPISLAAAAAIFLNPGEGFFIVPGATINSLTFTGDPVPVQMPTPLPCGCGQFNYLSSQTVGIGTYENMTGLTPQNGARFQRWNGHGYDIYTYTNCLWTPSVPTVGIGVAAWITVPCTTNNPCPTNPCVITMTCPTNSKTVSCGTNWSFDAPTNIVDNCCSNYSLTFSTFTNSGPCPLVITGTWLISDNCGNSNTCSQTVTVQDTTPPMIVCPTNIVVYSCTNVAVNYSATATDNCCSNVSVVCTPPSGAVFSSGTTNTVHCVATDCCGNTNSCDFTVTVKCPVDLVVTKTVSTNQVSPGQPLTYTITVSNRGPETATGVTLTDPLPCGVTLLTVTPSQGTYTVTDYWFAPSIPFVSGTEPVNPAVGDLNRDGKPEVVVPNGVSDSVSVFQNNSAPGTLDASSLVKAVDLSSGNEPHEAAIGDLDGDRIADLVVANDADSTVAIYRNQTTVKGSSITTGSFGPKVSLPAASGPISVAIGDIDGDGKNDLVVANFNSQSISVFRNTATPGVLNSGSFAGKVDFAVAAGSYPFSVALADLNCDGKLDIVVANNGNHTLSIFQNTSAIGSISLGARLDITIAGEPHSVAIGDLDRDGWPDLAVANFLGSDTVAVLRNKGSKDDLTAASFEAPVYFATAAGPYTVSIGDLNCDGKPDLAVASYFAPAVSILRNTSIPGQITASSFAPKLDVATASGLRGATIADLDGDGLADLIVAQRTGNSIAVLRNLGDHGEVACNLGSLAAGASATVTITVQFNNPAGVTNTASATANELDPNPANNSASVFVTANTPSLTLTWPSFGNTLTLTWPTNIDWTLQTRTSLFSGHWDTYPLATNPPIFVPMTNPEGYFRLVHTN